MGIEQQHLCCYNLTINTAVQAFLEVGVVYQEVVGVKFHEL